MAHVITCGIAAIAVSVCAVNWAEAAPRRAGGHKGGPVAAVSAVDYVAVDGVLYPTLGTLDPFARPLPPAAKSPDYRRDKIRAALADGRPKGWADLVAQVRAAGSPYRMLLLADQIVDSRLAYKPIGDNWRSATWAFTRGHGVCTEYAVSKATLLLDAGFPAERLRIMSMSPRSEAHAEYHVVLAAQVELPAERGKAPPKPAGQTAAGRAGTVIIDMSDRKAGKANGPVPLAAYRQAHGTRGIVWTGLATAGLDHSRRPPSAPAAKPRAVRGVEVRELGNAAARGTDVSAAGAGAQAGSVPEVADIGGRSYLVVRQAGDFVRYRPR
ncbi:MAG TPA: hypothetical protein VD995_26680 [Azospirillum sp.]|nr:hypothetical protein [Azospirillum sp.]